MGKVWFTLAVVTAIVVGSASSFAQSQTAAAPTQEELQEEYDILFQRMFADPTNLDLTFRFASVATQLENFESSISALERMLLLNPNLPRVKLEIGVLYFRLGAFPIARAYFLDAIAGGDAPGLVIERVNAYLEEIERRLSRHYFTGSIMVGFRAQSNANAGPASNLVRVFGIDTSIDDAFASAPDGNFQTGGNVTHFYDLRAGMLESWQTDAAAFVTRQFTFDQFDIGLGLARTGPLFALDPAQDDRFTIRPYVMADVLDLDRNLYFYSYGGGVEVSKVVDTRTTFTLDALYRHQEYIDSVSSPTATLLTNDGYIVRLSGQHFVSDNVRAGLLFTFSDKDAAADFNSNREYIIGGVVNIQYAPPMGLTNWPWRLDLSVLGIVTDYQAPDPTIDPTMIRQDQEWRVNVVNTFGFSREWSAFVQFGYSNNQSNLPNFTFDNFSGVVGVTRSFF